MLKAQENLKAITDARKLSVPEEHGANESDDEPVRPKQQCKMFRT